VEFGLGPAPDEPGCYIPEDMILSGMRDSFSIYRDRLVKLSQDKFASIPQEVFPDGAYENLLTRRKHHAYEKSLSADEWQARQDVLNKFRWRNNDNPDETEVRRLTAELLEQNVADDVRRREKHGYEDMYPETSLKIGDRVRHNTFGVGIVSQSADERGAVKVDFEDASRKIISSFLKCEFTAGFQ
jgi:hypothetical protein